MLGLSYLSGLKDLEHAIFIAIATYKLTRERYEWREGNFKHFTKRSWYLDSSLLAKY
jgi:hypothetical protein